MSIDMSNEIKNIIGSFTQLPYLFIGTGLSMRYAAAPSWGDLIKTLWSTVNSEEGQNYELFVMQVSDELGILFDPKNEEQKYELNPELAQRISKQFNAEFFKNSTKIQTVLTPEEVKIIIENHYDPFKFYISKLINSVAIDGSEESLAELNPLRENANKIAGIITTNYDKLLENVFPDFNVLTGQADLLVANTNNIFEIFKIHGCCTNPNSLVITTSDYTKFIEKLKYLSAKLLTIFVEHPIIFIGYGLGDRNIRYILEEICNCLTPEQMRCLQNNFIFIKPAYDGKEEIITQEFIFDRNRISMIEIVLKDYSNFYSALSEIKSSLPVKLMRKLQDMVCNYVYSTDKTNNIIFGNLNSPEIDDDKAAIYVGSLETISQIGFDYFTIMDIVEDILFDNKPFLIDERLITKTFKNFRSTSGSTLLPVYKYIDRLNLTLDAVPENYNIIRTYADISPNETEVHYIDKEGPFEGLEDIIKKFPNHIPKQIANIKYYAEIISPDDLSNYLKTNMERFKTENRLSAFKRLTALYDFKQFRKI